MSQPIKWISTVPVCVYPLWTPSQWTAPLPHPPRWPLPRSPLPRPRPDPQVRSEPRFRLRLRLRLRPPSNPSPQSKSTPQLRIVQRSEHHPKLHSEALLLPRPQTQGNVRSQTTIYGHLIPLRAPQCKITLFQGLQLYYIRLYVDAENSGHEMIHSHSAVVGSTF